ncbi:head maturation protease, ClpP-related [Phascolarctobacterium faecium]|uniref:head maturation protease, ClpP-related n=1 Tax=Phascolarctobacterium faecium TaxID=33025 RepID=UPI002672D3B7|nr:head maturation protease, ClpP-related [Phascolarctobacterium faecium]
MMEKFWQVRNDVSGDAEILIYGPIAAERSWFGDEATPQQFAQDLNELGGRDVTLRINSGGGDVFAAHAIHNLLKSYNGRVTAVIDGLAASAATVVVVAADKIIMPSNSLMMIHDPAIGLSGYYPAAELSKLVEALATIKTSIIAAYRKRCKVSDEEIEKMMANETWMGATECKEKGFADEIIGGVAAALNGNTLVINSVSYDLDRFANSEAAKNKFKQSEVRDMPSGKLEKFLNALGLQELLEDTQTTVPVGNQTTVNNTSSASASDNIEAVEAAVVAERQRVLDLEALDDGQNVAITAIINEAKKSGKTVNEVKNYVEAIKNAAPAGAVANAAQNVVATMVADNKNSGVDGVAANPAADEAAVSAAADAKALDKIAKVMNSKFGGAK